MSIETDIKEASLIEIQKGLSTITSGYLALRIREVDAESARRDEELKQKIKDLETRLNFASSVVKDMKKEINELKRNQERPVSPTDHRE